MTAKSDKPAKSKKTIIDVSHADEAPTQPNSKAVIVNNRSILKDPMVVVDEDEPRDTTQPVKIDTKELTAKAPTVAELAEAAAKKDKVPKPERAQEEPAPDTPDPAQAPKPEDKAPADDGQKPKPPDQAAIEAAAAEEAKHDADIDKLIESKQYYLPIETEEKRRSNRFVALGVLLSLVLILAWGDVALDSGIVSNSANLPHTHLFSSTNTAAAPTTPAVTSKTYKSPVDGLSFRYPTNWKLQANSDPSQTDGQEASLSIAGTDPSASLINLDRGSPTAGVPGTITYVNYQAVVIGGHHLYLRKLIFSFGDKTKRYLAAAGLTDTKATEAVGDSITTNQVTFAAKDGSPLIFQVLSYGSAGYTSTTSARAYFTGPIYKQVQAILLSLKY